ncbi:MAG: hypothetical protein IJK18_08645 [Clostridia bacterium]|nr:hypothetical protein [Clostridia bacterium]
MLQGFDENGNLKGVKVSKNGEVFVKIGGSSEDEGAKVITESKETTLYAGVLNIGLEEQTIGVAKKITEISIANYSETANVTISADETNYVIAPNVALDLPINKIVSIVGLSATEADTKVQYVIKGEV